MKSEVWPCWFSVRCWTCEEMFYLSFFFWRKRKQVSVQNVWCYFHIRKEKNDKTSLFLLIKVVKSNHASALFRDLFQRLLLIYICSACQKHPMSVYTWVDRLKSYCYKLLDLPPDFLKLGIRPPCKFCKGMNKLSIIDNYKYWKKVNSYFFKSFFVCECVFGIVI